MSGSSSSEVSLGDDSWDTMSFYSSAGSSTEDSLQAASSNDSDGGGVKGQKGRGAPADVVEAAREMIEVQRLHGRGESKCCAPCAHPDPDDDEEFGGGTLHSDQRAFLTELPRDATLRRQRQMDDMREIDKSLRVQRRVCLGFFSRPFRAPLEREFRKHHDQSYGTQRKVVFLLPLFAVLLTFYIFVVNSGNQSSLVYAEDPLTRVLGSIGFAAMFAFSLLYLLPCLLFEFLGLGQEKIRNGWKRLVPSWLRRNCPEVCVHFAFHMLLNVIFSLFMEMTFQDCVRRKGDDVEKKGDIEIEDCLWNTQFVQETGNLQLSNAVIFADMVLLAMLPSLQPLGLQTPAFACTILIWWILRLVLVTQLIHPAWDVTTQDMLVFWQIRVLCLTAFFILDLVMEEVNRSLFGKLMISLARLRREEKSTADNLNMVAHELKTPMQGLRLIAEQLENLPPEDSKDKQIASLHPRAVRELGKEAMMAIDTVTFLIGRVLATAAVKAETITINPSKVPLHAFFKSGVNALMDTATEEGLSLSVDVSERLPSVVKFDKSLVRVATWNYISNAIKYVSAYKRSTSDHARQADDNVSDASSLREKGDLDADVCVKVTKMRRPHSGDAFIAVKVMDRGPGVPEDVRERLFTRFARSHKHEGDVEGTGLGLSIMRRLTWAWGGDCWLEDRPDDRSGAVFCFSIPLVVVESAGGPEQQMARADSDTVLYRHLSRSEPIPSSNPFEGDITDLQTLAPENENAILIVDDSRLSLRMMTRVVKREATPGTRVETAPTLEAALKCFRDAEFRLVLLDLNLGDGKGRSGMELARQIRAAEHRQALAAQRDISSAPASGDSRLNLWSTSQSPSAGPSRPVMIVSITGETVTLDLKKELFSAGFDGLLPKPASTADICSLLAQAGCRSI